MKNEPVVLVIEDELSIRKFILVNLKNNMFEVIEAATGKEAFEALSTKKIDFVILDIMLPDIDGFTICEKIRKDYPMLPIIILSAKGQDMDKITGLELGADDYIIKPFNQLELVARVKTVMRRTTMLGAKEPEKNDCGPFSLDKRSKQIYKRELVLQLTQTEYKIMEFFMMRQNEAVSRDDLLNEVWGEHYFGDLKTVDVHIRRLREKIETDPSAPKYIQTVWGFGYRFQGEQS